MKRLKLWLYVSLSILGIWYIIVAIMILESGKRTIEDKILTNTWSIKNVKSVCLGSGCFDVELALTPRAQRKWLMYRDYLPEWSWMLFVFENKWVHRFWMKETLIPLDMLWIKDDGNGVQRVFHLAQDIQPCPKVVLSKDDCPSSWPKEGTEYVLEINAKQSKKRNITTWAELKLIRK